MPTHLGHCPDPSRDPDQQRENGHDDHPTVCQVNGLSVDLPVRVTLPAARWRPVVRAAGPCAVASSRTVLAWPLHRADGRCVEQPRPRGLPDSSVLSRGGGGTRSTAQSQTQQSRGGWLSLGAGFVTATRLREERDRARGRAPRSALPRYQSSLARNDP